MFIYRRKIRMHDTDATGALYFTNLLQITLEAFEEYFHCQNEPLEKILQQQQLLLPIVHTEANFFVPILLFDEITLHLSLTKITITSFTYCANIYKGTLLAGKASIVHVSYCPQKKTKIPHPQYIKNIFMSEDFKN